MPKKQTEWSRAYNAKAYDRVSVMLPKGRKSDVEAHAQSKGLSVNGLINVLLRSNMGLTEDAWNAKPEE
ncbi:MAG: hypothetical protein II920_07525 [Clostridia bacterium]|nr:hypothetical protein [Clostridia bacterium]